MVGTVDEEGLRAYFLATHEHRKHVSSCIETTSMEMLNWDDQPEKNTVGKISIEYVNFLLLYKVPMQQFT